jgi:CRISPR system Cascade subunit CasB
MSEKVSFHPEAALGHLLLRWWQGLENDKGGRAELRRAHDLTAVALTAAYQRFYRQAISMGWPESSDPSTSWRDERLAAIVGVLAHVKYPDDRKLAEIMSEGERPVFSELRFRRLLEAPTTDDLFLSLRRALPIVGHKANMHQLAEDLLYWGDGAKKKWAYAYYSSAKIQA